MEGTTDGTTMKGREAEEGEMERRFPTVPRMLAVCNVTADR